MDRLIATNSVPFANRDIAPATGTPQYATDGNPNVPTPATIWPSYAWNMVQDEIMAVIVGAGLTPDDTNWAQLLAAIRALISAAAPPGAQWTAGAVSSVSGATVAANVLTILSQSGRLLAIQVFASVGTHTYTPTTGTHEVLVLVLGGGASGAGSAATGAGQTSVGAGGAAGSAGLGLITTGFAGVTITVGAGGAGVGGANANAGGASSFGTIISAPGGPQTSFEGATTGPWATGSNGGVAATGGSIWNGGGAPGGESVSLSSTMGWGGQGAASILGGGGGQVPMGANGTNGTAPGSGGGGTVNYPSFGSLIGGNGAAGIVIVAELS